ncbi:MAG: hypothetical protein COA84_13730 [Robiginitomaculum sp.]|nr:MAG: hypothetical protein COA84_13730 [Robiginitomaculum sp.]
MYLMNIIGQSIETFLFEGTMIAIMLGVLLVRIILYPLILSDCWKASRSREMSKRQIAGIEGIPPGHCW